MQNKNLKVWTIEIIIQTGLYNMASSLLESGTSLSEFVWLLEVMVPLTDWSPYLFASHTNIYTDTTIYYVVTTSQITPIKDEKATSKTFY